MSRSTTFAVTPSKAERKSASSWNASARSAEVMIRYCASPAAVGTAAPPFAPAVGAAVSASSGFTTRPENIASKSAEVPGRTAGARTPGSAAASPFAGAASGAAPPAGAYCSFTRMAVAIRSSFAAGT